MEIIIEILEALPWAVGTVSFFVVLWYILDPQDKRRKC